MPAGGQKAWWSSQGRTPPTGPVEVVQTSRLLTFNSEQQLSETKTDQEKSIGVVYNKELVKDICPMLVKSYMKALNLLKCLLAKALSTGACFQVKK